MQLFFILVLFFALATSASIKVKNIQPLEGRIVGGFDIDIRSVPYQVSVQKNDKHICGGSIIAKDKILTAAHCTDGNTFSQLSIHVGFSNYSEGETVPLRGLYQHPSYDRWYLINDVSVLYLSKPLTLGPSVQLIKLATVRRDPGSYLLVSGWGSVTGTSTSLSTKLRAAYVPIVSQDDCINSYPYDIINNVMLCAGFLSGGKDACQGDSGGPLVDLQTGEQLGVVSWGYGCGNPGKPGVYASIPDLRGFIQET